MGCGSVKVNSEIPSEETIKESSEEKQNKNKKGKEKEKNKKKKKKKKTKSKQSDGNKKNKQKKSKSESKTESKNEEKASEKEIESSPSEKYEIKIGKKMGKKDYRLNEQDKENIIKQDLKEAQKRQSRFVKFSKPRKEVEFNHQPEKEENNILDQPYSQGYEDEIYNGLNYGKPIRLFNQIWLTVDLPVEPDVYTPQVQIPPGWRIPTLEDYKELFDFCGNSKNSKLILRHKKLLNMNRLFQYVTLNKVHENYFDGHYKNAWKFYCVAFDFEDEEETKEKEKKDIGEITIKKKKIINDTIISEYEGKENEDDNNEDEDDINNKKKGIKKSELINPDENDEKMAFEELNPFSMIIKEEGKEEENKNENNIDKNKDINDEHSDKKIQKIKFKTSEELHNILQKNIEKNNNPDQIPINDSYTKYIFEVNTFKYKPSLRCKLISDNTYIPSLTFKCPLVIECGYRAYFEIPSLYNLTTFEWEFNDVYCKERFQTSDKSVACHIFDHPGEYKIDLCLRVFEFREYTLSRKVWVIPEIIYYDQEIIDGINYGQPIKIGSQIWLDRDIPNYLNYKDEIVNLRRGKGPGVNGENSYPDSICACPNGWRLPKKEEIETLLKFCGRNNEQRVFFFTRLDGGFLAQVDGSGQYDLVTSSFRLPSSQENYFNFDRNKVKPSVTANENRNKKIVKNEEDAFEPDPIFTGVGDVAFDKKLQNFLKEYGNVILNTSNIGEIYDKEVYSLSIENNKAYLGFRSTNLNSPFSFFSTRCILDQKLDLDLGLKDTSFPALYEINFEINYPNVSNVEWNFGDGTPIIKKELKLKHVYEKPNVYGIKVVITLFDKYNYEIKRTLNIYSATKLDGEETEFISKDQIFILQLGDLFKVRGVHDIHFSRAVAPIAPLIYENGFYISFNNKLENKLKLFRVLIDEKSKSMKEYFKGEPLYEEESSLPLDICCTPYGCCLLLTDSRDEDLLFIEMVSHKGELMWRNNIMQNGSFPVEAKVNQLIFFNDITKKPEFGMNAMFHPYSGRLSYGARRIMCIFSYMNHFGVRVGGSREDNSGDLIITYTDDGTEVNLVQNWSTSHSLTQRSYFGGQYFYIASLGDYHPANIKVLRIDPMLKVEINKNKITQINSYDKNDEFGNNFGQIEQPEQKLDHYTEIQEKLLEQAEKENNKIKTEFGYQESYYMRNLDKCGLSDKVTLRHNYIYSEIVDGSIPGNLMGLTSGRLGNLVPFQTDKLAIVYSRIKCVDGGNINKNSELSLIIFNNKLKVENVCHYRDGELINCIKHARYGNNMLIMISQTQKISQDHKYIYDKYYFLDDSIDEDHYACNFFLVNAGGKIKSNLMSYNCNFFAPGDDFETLLDGSVIWAFVDDEDNFYLAILPIKNTQIILDRHPREIMPISKLDLFLAQKDEQAEKGRIEREKELMKNMGIDQDEIKKRILESEKLAREQREKELEEINKYDFNEYELNNEKNKNKKKDKENKDKDNEDDMVNQLSETSNKVIKSKKESKINRDEDKTIEISNESNSKISGISKMKGRKKTNKKNKKEDEEEIEMESESKNTKKKSKKEESKNESKSKDKKEETEEDGDEEEEEGTDKKKEEEKKEEKKEEQKEEQKEEKKEEKNEEEDSDEDEEEEEEEDDSN